MTNVHCKLLVLISKYGQMPVGDSNEPETWIRELPLVQCMSQTEAADLHFNANMRPCSVLG